MRTALRRSNYARFSAASGRGLIEAGLPKDRVPVTDDGFPRHRAAASLKPGVPFSWLEAINRFSAASGRGLIEARFLVAGQFFRERGFPRHRAAASLKRTPLAYRLVSERGVFRGIGPRPH